MVGSEIAMHAMQARATLWLHKAGFWNCLFPLCDPSVIESPGILGIPMSRLWMCESLEIL